MEVERVPRRLASSVRQQNFCCGSLPEQRFFEDLLGGDDLVGKSFVLSQLFDECENEGHVLSRCRDDAQGFVG